MGCRYADVLVHRCLAASLGLMPLPEALRDKDHMERIVDNMNDRHTNAARAGRSSAQLHTLVFFRDRQQVADARVIKVQSNGMIALVPKFGIEGPVYFGKGDEGDGDGTGGASLNEEKQVGSPHAVVLCIALRETTAAWLCVCCVHGSWQGECTSAAGHIAHQRRLVQALRAL